MKKILVLSLILAMPALVLAQPSIRLSRVSWEAGDVQEGTVLREKIIISNEGTETLEVTARAGCSCITFDRTVKKIEPGRKSGLTVIFNTKEKNGKITEYIYFSTNDPEFPYITFIAEANVKGGVPLKKVEKPGALSPPAKNNTGIKLLMFSSPGCSTCRKLKENFIPKLAGKYGLELNIEHLTTDAPENYERLIALENLLGDKNNKLPALVIGPRILGGEKEIKKQLGKILETIKENGTEEFFDIAVEAPEAGIQEKLQSIRLLPIIGAGLLDGINPCAFATIIFFISYLAFAGRSGKEILSTGISFTLAIFLCYTLIGLGAYKLLEKLSGIMPLVSLLIKIATVTMVFILGLLSIYDYIKCRQGKPREMKLQLSPLLKSKIHKSITSKREDFGESKILKLAIAGFSVGVLVSVFEFACTGQIYLPTIMYMFKLPGMKFGALGYLLLYNFMFVVPLIIIFVLAWKGITSEQFTDIMLKHISKIKIGMAVFFFGIGILLIFT